MFKKILAVAAILIILAVILVIFQKQPDNNNNITQPQGILNPDEEQPIIFEDLFAPQAYEIWQNNSELIVIDISSKEKYNTSHIPGSLNFEIINGTFESAINSLDKSKPYLVYGDSYNQSVVAARKMTNAGFDTVFRLDDGLRYWIIEGYPVE